MSATPQFRYPRPDRPDEPIVWVNWHVSSHTEMDAGSASPIDPAWWDAATETEREIALEILRRQVAEHASETSGRPVEVGEVSYTIRRSGSTPARPDEEPTP